MAFFDVATLGVIISVVGWGISRIEGLRGKLQDLQIQVSHNNGRIEVLQADFLSKLDIVIFRLRVLEEEVKQND